MKNTILTIILLLVAGHSQLCAQNRAGEPRQPTQGQKATVFSTNHSIRLHGKLPTGTTVDLSTLGVGPAFLVEVPLTEEISSLTCKYTVKEIEGSYQIFYTVSVQVKFESSRMNGTVNYEYKNYTLEGNTICNSGSSVVIFKNGEETLSISLAKEPASE